MENTMSAVTAKENLTLNVESGTVDTAVGYAGVSGPQGGTATTPSPSDGGSSHNVVTTLRESSESGFLNGGTVPLERSEDQISPRLLSIKPPVILLEIESKIPGNSAEIESEDFHRHDQDSGGASLGPVGGNSSSTTVVTVNSDIRPVEIYAGSAPVSLVSSPSSSVEATKRSEPEVISSSDEASTISTTVRPAKRSKWDMTGTGNGVDHASGGTSCSGSESPLSPLTADMAAGSAVGSSVPMSSVAAPSAGTGLAPATTAFVLPTILQQPLEDRRGRRLYVGNIPAGVSDTAVVQFFNGALLAASGVDYCVAEASGQFPVLRAEGVSRRNDSVEHRYCFLEFRTAADCTLCLKLDGINFNGYTLKVGRPNDYNQAPINPEPPGLIPALPTGCVVSALASKIIVPETKVYATDLPFTMTNEEFRALVERFGTVKSAALMHDLRTGQSMGCGVVEFDDAAAATAAIETLDGTVLDGSVQDSDENGANKSHFSKRPLPAKQGLSLSSSDSQARPPIIMSQNVTELPTSMTHKVFNNAIIGAQVKATRREGAVASRVVQLLNAVYPEDLIKNSEYDSILENVKEEASCYGELLDAVIPRPPSDLSFKAGVGKVFLYYADVTAARKAQMEFNGRKFEDRRVICAAFYPLDKFLAAKYMLM